MIFNTEGKIFKTVSAINSAITKEFEYNEYGQLYKVYDGRHKSNNFIQRYFEFEYYNNALLKSITLYKINTSKIIEKRQKLIYIYIYMMILID